MSVGGHILTDFSPAFRVFCYSNAQICDIMYDSLYQSLLIYESTGQQLDYSPKTGTYVSETVQLNHCTPPAMSID
jgi:hypothetical protein